MTNSIFCADFKAEPYWWEAARPSSEHATHLPEAADVAIVGSGYAGLSAALELARAGIPVPRLSRVARREDHPCLERQRCVHL